MAGTEIIALILMIAFILLYILMIYSIIKTGIRGTLKWIFIIITTIIGMLLIIFLIANISNIQAADWAQIVLTLGLVSVTTIYAWSTVNMAKEMREQRQETFLPIIDIVVQPLKPKDLALLAYTNKEDILNIEIPCILRNIGVGPAINLYSFIQNPNLNKKQRYEFGTLAKGDTTTGMDLTIIKDAHNFMLAAFYYDVYGNLLSSSRKVVINEQNKFILGNLSIEPVILVEESNMP